MPNPTPDNYPGLPGQVLYAGIEPPPSGELRLITDIALRATTASAQANVPSTFGQPIKNGDFDPATESLYAKVDGASVPLQVDAVSTFANGKARFAVLSTEIASLPGSGTKSLEIYAGPKVSPGSGTFDTDSWNPVFVATISGVTWTATPRAQLLSQIASNTGLLKNGPVVKEFEVVASFKNGSDANHPHLMLRCHVRFYSNGRIKTDAIFENGWLLVASPADITYSLNCTQGAGGATIFTQASFTHHQRCRWRKVFWQGGEPLVRPRHNKAYFLDSRATYNYNRNRTLGPSVLSDVQSELNASNTGPMGWSLLTRYMPGTGGRGEIAPVPLWTAMYLITQDDRAYDAMMAQSVASASAPVHYRDEATGLPTIATNRMGITFDYGTSSPTVPRSASGTGWTIDRAHQGAYNYIPYLISGDYFHLEELVFWASHNTMSLNPGLMGASGTLLYSEQVRGQAWATRALLEAVFALPDGHALKGYFRTAVDDNAAWQSTNYGAAGGNSWVSPLGGTISQYDDWRVPEYQADFFTTTWAWAIENGETGFNAAFNNTCRYTVGRYTEAAQAQGWCTSHAAGQWLWTRSTPGNVPITTWGAYFTRNYGSATCLSTAKPEDPGYPDWGGGYAAISRGMLAAAQNAGYADAAAAYTRWVAYTPLLDSLPRGFPLDPSYDIVPR